MCKPNTVNIEKLTKDKIEFLKYAKKIEVKFTGPSAYFYQKVIKELRNKTKINDYQSLFSNDIFIEHLYATLTSWGMHRMNKATQMTEFKEFENSISDNKKKFIRLSQKRLETVILEDIKKDVLDIFNSLKVMSRSDAPKFVANSKIMHFLLPDLIPPMDKGHIYYFFYGEMRTRPNGKIYKYLPAIKEEEKDVFWELLHEFQKIAISKELKLDKTDLKESENPWNTSIPKLIDNAIIGFNEKQKSK